MVDATVLGALGSDARTTAMSSRVFGAAHVAGRAEVTVRGEEVGQFSGTVGVPRASRCRLHLGFWCLQLPAPSVLLPWLCSPVRPSPPAFACADVRLAQASWYTVQRILGWTLDVLLVVI